MFRFLGQIVCRGCPLWLATWVVLLLGTRYTAPPWEVIAQDREFAFLPASAPSRQAEEVYTKAFPTDRLSSNIVLVLHRTDNEQQHLKGDLAFIDTVLEPRLRKIAESEGGLAYELRPTDEPLFGRDDTASSTPAPPPNRSIIARIQTPNTPGLGSLLVSPDGQVLLVVIELTTEFLSNQNWPIIDKVHGLIGQLRERSEFPAGLKVSITGSAVIGRAHNLAQLRSVQATGTLTVVLVIVLLILIYRAPLLALIPLATVYLAVQLALNILALLGGAGYLTLFQGLQIYITILAYGAGVDYCLFLTARYREELDQGKPPAEAVAAAISNVGHALLASAATVMCGIGMMVFAHFGKFREAGIAIPLSLFLVLCATLTFSPSLLRLAGRWAFWPQHRPARASSRGASAAAPRGWRQLLAPGELERIWDRVGQFLLARPGRIWFITAALMAPFAILAGLCYDRLSFDLIGDLPADAPSVAGTRLLQEHFPAGMIGPATVVLTNEHIDFSTGAGRDAVARITDRLRQQAGVLGLADVRSLSAPLGITSAAKHDLLHFDIPAELRREQTERVARQHYVGDMGEGNNNATRLDLVLRQSPFSRQSVDDLARADQTIRDALPSALRADTCIYFTGTTASVRDLMAVTQQDRTRIETLVLASVFVVLVLLLRGLVVPVYLLLSVLLSYFTTLGVSFALFWLLDPHGFTGIDWKVAVFLFTILIAVGEDYNIFLMTRVHEEQRRRGPLRGITEALDRTGPIISSCGIIMAGTFASLLAGSLSEMKQLGFALSFGVLLDTFVVRPILVPAFLLLLQSGRLRLPGPTAPMESGRSPEGLGT